MDMVSTNFLFLLCIALYGSLVRGQFNGSCVAAGYANCNGASTGGCWCDRQCYRVLDCCPDIVQACQPPNGRGYVCYQNSQCTQLVIPSSAATVSGCCNSVGSTHYIHISEPTKCIPCSELQIKNGSRELLECINTTVLNTTFHWEKLTSSFDGSCSNLNLTAASGGLSGSEETEERVVVSNSSTLEFDPVVFGDEGCYRCVVGGVPSDIIYSVTMSPEEGVFVFPLNLTFNRGDSVTFNCSAQGGPGNTYQWQWNSTDLGNETAQTLTITQITVNSGGEYTCVVSNAAGSGNASTWLNVSPEMVSSPTNVSARNGTVHMLICEAEAFPEPQYEWLRIGGTFNENVDGNNSSTLVFDPVIFGDEGEYYCRATSNGVAVISDNATLTVSPEGSVSAVPLVINAERNTIAEFTCSALGGPGNNFTWIRMSDGAVVARESVLQIAVQDVFVGGGYQCLVANEAGNDTDIVTLNVAPLILNAPSDLHVATAGDVALMCSASGYPVPSISWTHNGTAVNESDRITVIQESSTRSSTNVLSISAAMANDSGEYTCIASSPVSVFQKVSNGPVAVFVQVSPEGSVNATPQVINAERNTTVEFTCSALGGPGNNFTWIRMSEGSVVAREPVLHIAVKDAFVGSDYQCRVVNKAGNDTDTVILNVAPLILNAPSDLHVATAGDVALMCSASGYPVPSISWTHNGTAVNESDRITVIQESSTRSSTSVLSISAAMANDSGQYTCIASSPVSDFQTVSSEPVTVFVHVSPGRSSTEAIVIGVVTSVAIIAISIVVVVIIAVIRRQSGTSCNLRNLNKRSDATSTLKGTDMSMTECAAYVETRYKHQQDTNDPNDDHIYECVGLPFHQGTEACEHHYEEPTPRGNVYSY